MIQAQVRLMWTLRRRRDLSVSDLGWRRADDRAGAGDGAGAGGAGDSGDSGDATPAEASLLDFEAVAVDESVVDVGQYAGTDLVIWFWAPW